MDEIASTWYDAVHDVTFSNSIIAEALHDSYHPKGPHGYGLLIGTSNKNISIIRNLMAHAYQRNPLINTGSQSIVMNNLIYNYGAIASHMPITNSLKTTFVGNVYIKGPDSSTILPIYPYGGDGTATLFVDDNEYGVSRE